MSDQDKENITSFYTTVLEVEPEKASADELYEVLDAGNAVERIAYRKQVARAGHKTDFVRLNKGARGQS